MYLWVLLCSGVHRTLYRTPKDPQFVNIGVVVVYHENRPKKMKKNEFLLDKWFSMVNLKPVNHNLTLRMQFMTI